MTDSTSIRLVLNGKAKAVRDASPTRTLLDWLREDLGLHGTKEGCAEGDCGACTVLLERRGDGDRVERRAVNACLTLLGQVDGLGVRTIEGLAAADGTPHPVQAALAEGYGTQCGFCTPGFVMSAAALSAAGQGPDLDGIHDALAGNLCRCTGYRPIVDAVRSVLPARADPLAASAADLAGELAKVGRGNDLAVASDGREFWAPRSLKTLLALRRERPDAVLLAGGTDLNLLASRDRRPPAAAIHVGNVPELWTLERQEDRLLIGAAVTYDEAMPALLECFPTLRPYLGRLGSRQIRNMGTIGGNLGTASPIGDFLPLLLALDAGIEVSSEARTRLVAADDFFLGYRKTVVAGDEIITCVSIPKLRPTERLFADKVSKRRDQDISAVCGAYRLTLEGTSVVDIRLAFGGLAAMPRRARQAEQTLREGGWTEGSIDAAAEALRRDFTPIDDVRASAEYRLSVAGGLLHRLYARASGLAQPLEVDAA